MNLNKSRNKHSKGMTLNRNLICECKTKHYQKVVLLLLSGAIVGFLNGFLGGGGGMIVVPILQKVLGLTSKESHATAIAIIFPLSLISASIYVYNGVIDSYLLVLIGIGVVLGGIFGSLMLKILPEKIIKLIFVLIMLSSGIRMIL